jgi:hypothetical protein
MVHRASNPGYYDANFYSDNIHNNEAAVIYGQPIRCCGLAGSVVLFDTNGLHRGNRNSGPRRDIWQHSYTSGDHVYPLAGLHPDVGKKLNEDQKRIVHLK